MSFFFVPKRRGNIIGSNIFNIYFILGISAFVSPIQVAITALYDNLFLFIISLLSLLLIKKVVFHKKIGLSMIIIYILYTVWIIIR
ncbi:hypothetical protein [Tannockella kyphosi]|uniref:hypothetical protein n=1 Tax=Tannockella kyphosi TaxID=2899121 RepID=UPI0037D9A4EF